MIKVILKLPIAAIILLRHGINPFRKLGCINDDIKNKLSLKEKEYIMDMCIYENTKELIKKVWY